MYEMINAINSQDIELLKELMQEDPLKIWSDGEYLDAVVQTCNIELLQAVFETWPEDGPIDLKDCFDLDPLLSISPTRSSEAEKMKMVQFLIPYLTSLKDFFPGLVAHCEDKNFLITEFLIHKFYSENNSLYPLIKRLEAAVEKSHYICIFLHDDIVSVMDCFEYVQDNFERFDYSWFTHFRICVEILTKLLAKENHESMQLAIETVRVLLEKNLSELAKDWMYACLNHYSPNYPLNVHEVQYQLPLRAMFQFLYNLMNAKTEEKIYGIILEWFKRCFPTDREYGKIFNQSKEFLRPFIRKPLYKKLKIRAPRNIAATANGKVRSLKEFCRDAIRCEIFEQMDDVKEFMHRIWMLQLPQSVKCFLLYIPDPSWINNLQLS